MLQKILPMVVLVLSSCAITGYEEVFKVPDEKIDQLINETSYPRAMMKRETEIQPEAHPGRMELSLRDCIKLALENNRSYLAALENLFLKRIEFNVEQRNYFPLLDPLSVSYFSSWRDNTISQRSDAYEASIGVSQRIPFGGRVTAGTRLTHTIAEDRQAVLTPSSTLTLPLIKGSGLIVGMEGLVASARAYKYAEREVENLKQVFLIEVAEKYFSILAAQKEIENLRINFENARHLRLRAETLFRFGRVSKVDVFRAQFLETEAQRDLQLAEEAIKISLDTLKIDLGIAPETEISLVDQEISFRKIEFDEASYVSSVMKHNILWQNTVDQFEDAKRALVVAHDKTRIHADISASYSQTLDAETPADDFDMVSENWKAGIEVKIPVDRMFIEADYHKSVLTFIQSERKFRLSRDVLIKEARSRIIAMRQAEFRVTSQKNQVEQSEKALKLLRHQYERGLVSNMAVIDAQRDLVRAQNALLRSLVDYKIGILRLRQFEGTLVIDDEGKWLE